MIKAREVTRRYQVAKVEVDALRGVSIDVNAGESVAIVGRSGSGKSTLLSLLAGLDQPSSGLIEVDGRELHRLSAGELARYRREVIGIVFQSFNLVPTMSALDNVALPLAFAKVGRGKRRSAAYEALDKVGLAERASHNPTELSGGEQQRVAIARALVGEPRLLLADEPTGNLDSNTASEILTILDELRKGGLTMVMVTHDLEAAKAHNDRLIRLADGKVVS